MEEVPMPWAALFSAATLVVLLLFVALLVGIAVVLWRARRSGRNR